MSEHRDYINKEPVGPSDKFERMHDYHDEQGRYIVTKVIWRTPDGDKKARWGVKERLSYGSEGFGGNTPQYWPSDVQWSHIGLPKDSQTPMFNIQRVKQAIAAGEPVLFLEGEKDVLTAAELGIVATCNPEGATHFNRRHVASLVGINAIVVPDNDEDGERHAGKVINYLRGHANSLKLMVLPDLPEKGDLTDWVEDKRLGSRTSIEIKTALQRFMAGAPLRTFQYTQTRTPTVKKSYINFKSGTRLEGYKFRHDTFSGTLLWRTDGAWNRLQDPDIRRIRNRLEEMGLDLGIDVTHQHIMSFCEEDTVNVALLYAEEQAWDGTPRLEHWLYPHAEAGDTPYVRGVSKTYMLGAAARLYKPGIKFDTVMVLDGAEGLNKSTLLRVLALRKVWFTDQLRLDADSKKVIEVTRGKLVVELAELNGIKKSEVEEVLSFLSAQVDESRAAYGRENQVVPRAYVFGGTTNNSVYLKRDGKNRRFWPMRIKDELMDLSWLKQNIRQMWAEALVLVKEAYAEGGEDALERLVTLPMELWDDALEETQKRVDRAMWVVQLEEYLTSLDDQPDVKLKSTDIFDYAVECGMPKSTTFSVVKQVVEGKGFEHSARIRFGGADKRQCAGYRRGNAQNSVYCSPKDNQAM